MDEDQKFAQALFRFSLISPLLHCDDEVELGESLRRIAQREHEIPHSGKNRIGVKTLKKYLKNYRKGGFDSLKRNTRSDRKALKSFSTDIAKKVFALKIEEPRRSAKQIVNLIQGAVAHETKIHLKERTVSRLLKENGLNSKSIRPKKIHHRFEMEHINDLWETDICEGLVLPDNGHLTHCFAFLDDFSRVITHAQFYRDEKLPRLEDCLKKAILKRGIPKVIYADNGKVFVSNHFKRICAELGIRLMHHLPYSPQSKGKIERFFLRMQKEFLLEARGAGIHSLEELNSHFQSWLEIEYHRREHHSLGVTPLDRFTKDLVSTRIKKVESLEEITEIFLYRDKRTVHKKSGTIKLAGNEYQVTDVALLGLEIEARFDPYDLERIFIYRDGAFVQTALPLSLTSRRYTSIPEENDTTAPQIRKSSSEFFARLKKREEELLRQEAQHIDFSKSKKEQ